MPAAAVLLAPLFVCACFAMAMHVLWQRTSQAPHAMSWLWAFWMAALGWAAAGVEIAMSADFQFPGAATLYCWLAGVMLAARGVRQRAGRADRWPVLLAIWIGTAVGIMILLDLAMPDLALATAMELVVTASGAAIAGLAVGPRNRHASRSAWIASGLLGVAALACLCLAMVVIDGPASARVMGIAALGSIPAIVAGGLLASIALNDDRANALERLARTDALTNVWNRRGFEEAARHLLDRLHASGGNEAAVAIADIDGFKGINDRFGHGVGDQTLVRFAETLRSVTEPGDVLARLGGEEFALLSIGPAAASLQQRMERARLLLCVPSIDPKSPPPVTASFGVSTMDADHRSLREALERADRALYRAKSDGRNRVMVAE